MQLQQQNVQSQNIQIQNAATRFAQMFSSINTSFTNFPPVKFIFNSLKSISGKMSTLIQKTLPGFIQKIAINVKTFAADISSKIAVIFGEEKLAKLKNMEKFIGRGFKKVFSLFGFIHPSKEDDEASEIVKREEKKITFLQKLKKKFFLDKDGKDDYDS